MATLSRPALPPSGGRPAGGLQTPDQNATQAADLGQRLGGLRFNAQHRKLITGSGVGWALDAMDVGLISFVMAALAAEWGLGKTELSWVASIGFLGMAIGATFGGLLADRFGRRNVFAATLLVYGLATGASALAWSLGALLAFRFLVGLGLGAELPVASTLVSELSPTRIRGRMVVALESFWAVGWILAAAIGYFVVPDFGWRWALALGVVPALYAAVIRWGLPESPLWLASQGRSAEAERVVRRFEDAAPTHTAPADPAAPDAPPTPRAPADAGSTRRANRVTEGLWSGRFARRTVGIWAIWFLVNFSYYGAFIWLPTLLVDRGFDIVQSFGYVLIMTLAQLPGYLLAAVLIEVWGRRATLATFLAGSAASAVLFGMADSLPVLLATGAALSFFNLGAWGALYAVTPEIYPTRLRGSGAGAAAGFGRIASIIAPLLVPVLLPGIGAAGVFAVFAVAFCLAALATTLLPDRTGVALET
ncbi:MFS transporter [Kytococcus sedentarius]|uniref:Sugar phosphate permease n=1 Tax=Kytococcus sedentarius (strain ATCC 14392 / DSM 20547 / JCM 11482 / CCUG 33030 / NBRC 15357 / NCTC 11040 / CCM 314 / 541) TaxID=478801 RepID=C7NLC6_KYTSD|nr:MFS transporter [Kytococcus sedentarius]ACV07122.1 sugar phosphate permease [Kytococcus sedentarius DSM 20547]QQB63107.1 MFS transporter [Kytococcus sedentarius]STX14048.1 Putative niacin/nicotinamide transporter NaiP [Kytococcus sedentarius]